MGTISHLLNQTLVIVETSTDRYGDQELVGQLSVPCRFRYITEVDKMTLAEAEASDAMVWVEPDAPIQSASILFIDEVYWRIDRMIKARKMDDTVEFLKVYLSRHELAYIAPTGSLLLEDENEFWLENTWDFLLEG